MELTILPDSFLGDPEATAMLQAFYSRSHKPIKDRLDSLGDDMTSVKKALSNFYVGYGHSSIGDCGDTVIFIEGVSILAAKWVQNFALYNGQETSTRYIDFTNQGYVLDESRPQLDDIIPNAIEFVNYLRPKVVDYLKQQHPLEEGQDEKQWLRAIDARSFDIVRGFLPAGCKTQLSIKTSLRKMQEQFHALQHLKGQLPEVGELGDKALELLRTKYPSSFYAEDDVRASVNYDNGHCYANVVVAPNDLKDDVRLKLVLGEDIGAQLGRNKSDPVNTLLDFIGDVYFDLNIDFGCWRDLQRHRRINSPMPYFGVAANNFKFNDWYIDNLPPEVQEEARSFVYKQYTRVIEAYQYQPNVRSQYYMPLGTSIITKHKAPISAFIYMLELRSNKGVHPILRNLVHKLHERFLISLDANNLEVPPMFIDKSEDDFSIKRGNATITDAQGNQID